MSVVPRSVFLDRFKCACAKTLSTELCDLGYMYRLKDWSSNIESTGFFYFKSVPGLGLMAGEAERRKREKERAICIEASRRHTRKTSTAMQMGGK